jgi:hypothetical protein
MMKRTLALGALLLAAGALFVRVGGGAPRETLDHRPVSTLDLSGFPAAAPERLLRLLFIHHSCGGQMLADPGPEQAEANCVFVSHSNGGGLRKKLEAQHYEVHEASYGSEIGEATDLFDWLPKFRSKMDKILAVDLNDRPLPEGQKNQIVVFKSCFPNSAFVAVGEPPGDPAGPLMTLSNAKATMMEVRSELAKHPDVLFVYLTAPPLAPKMAGQRAYAWIASKILGRPSPGDRHAAGAALARSFNDWMKAEDGWLRGYPHTNIVVFDYYDVLTQGGESNLSRYATGDGSDSHPSSEGNQAAAQALVPFINRAARRAGLSR